MKRGPTLVEFLIVVAIVGIVAAVAVPSLLRARMAENEAAAVVALRGIIAAEIAYAAACGNDAYTTSLETLGRPAPDGSTFLAPAFAMVAPRHQGYVFALQPGTGARLVATDCHGRPTFNAYYVSATPTSPGWTGTKSFAANTVGTIWERAGALPPGEPFLPPALPVQ